MDSWYVLDEKSGTPQRLGPFSLAKIEHMVRTGAVTPATRVAVPGSRQWTEACRAPMLKALFGTDPPFAAQSDGVSVEDTAYLPTFSFRNAFGVAWQGFTSQWGKLLLVSLIFIGISISVAAPEWIAQGIRRDWRATAGDEGARSILHLFGVILSILIPPPQYAGAAYAGVRAVRGELEVADVFQGFVRYPRALGTGLLFIFIWIGGAIVAYIPSVIGSDLLGKSGLGSAGSFIGVPLLIFGVAALVLVFLGCSVILGQLLPMIADPLNQSPGGWTLIKEARRRTKGKELSLLGLIVVGYLICIASIFGMGVGIVLLGVPLLMTLVGAAYEMIRVHDKSAAPSA